MEAVLKYPICEVASEWEYENDGPCWQCGVELHGSGNGHCFWVRQVDYVLNWASSITLFATQDEALRFLAEKAGQKGVVSLTYRDAEFHTHLEDSPKENKRSLDLALTSMYLVRFHEMDSDAY